jgi:homoserine kinase type II
LAPWLPGVADFQRDPRPQRLRAALETLAEFHRHAATVPGVRGTPQVPQGVVERYQALGELQRDYAPRILAAPQKSQPSALADRARRIIPIVNQLANNGLTLLEASMQTIGTQPCIRDIWHDHVLFQEDRVSGIVDFGAMRLDSVAGDVARLLGSLVGDSEDGWAVGLDAYTRVRPLTDAERRLVRTYDATGVMLSGVNWLRWIYLEHRQFEDLPAVLNRLDQLIPRLEHLLEHPRRM